MSYDQSSGKKWTVAVYGALIASLMALVLLSINLSLAASSLSSDVSSDLRAHTARQNSDVEHIKATLIRLEEGQVRNHAMIEKILRSHKEK